MQPLCGGDFLGLGWNHGGDLLAPEWRVLLGCHVADVQSTQLLNHGVGVGCHGSLLCDLDRLVFQTFAVKNPGFVRSSVQRPRRRASELSVHTRTRK